MTKNKLIKILASISAMGAIGTGTAISMTSCGNNTPPAPVAINALTLGAATSQDLITCIDGAITGLPNSGASLYMFMKQNGYNALEFDSTITSIGESAFEGFTPLSNNEVFAPITFASPTLSFGDYAFHGCSNITQINLAENTIISSIGKRAFSACSNVIGFSNNVSPTTITSVGDNAFEYCNNLTVAGISNITITDSAKQTFPNGVYWLKSGDTVFHTSGCLVAGEIKFPDSWVTIPDSLLAGCGSVTKVDFNLACGNIGQWAFENCRNLASIITTSNIVNPWTSIGMFAFDGCLNLQTLKFNGWATGSSTIDTGAFNGVKSNGIARTGSGHADFKTKAEARYLYNWTIIDA